MNRIIKAALMIAATTLMVACAKENNGPVIEKQGTIEISIDGVMGGYASQDVTKSEIQTVARLMWGEGDKVYAYDGTTYLGELTALIAGTDGTVAKLSGSITAPSGTKPITLVHSPLFSGQPTVAADGKISLNLASQSQDKVPFLVYSVLPSNTTADALNNNYVAKFNIATSIYKCNIAGLPVGGTVSEVRVYEVNTVCNLQLSDTVDPVVSGSNPGVNMCKSWYNGGRPACNRHFGSCGVSCRIDPQDRGPQR